MIIKEYRIKIPGVGRYNLYPIGDLQMNASGFNEELFKKLEKEIKEDPHPLVIGMGDYSDNFRFSVQTKIETMSAGDKGFRKVLDKMAWDELDKMTKYLSAVFNGKNVTNLGLLEGHHFYTFDDNVTSTQKMCGTYKSAYLNEMAFIKIQFINGDHFWPIVIHAQHGSGGAGFSGPDMANLERRTMPYWNADIYLRGHSTKRWAAPVIEYDLSRNSPVRLVARTKWIVNTGGFMSGYVDSESTYVSRKNMPPASLGYTVISINLERHRPTIGNKTGEYVNIGVSLR